MKRAMKTAFVAFALSLLAACSGGSNEPAPAAQTPAGQEELKKLAELSKNAANVCCLSASPYMISVGQALQSPGPDALPAQPNMGGCYDAIQNFELTFRTIDNGAYANRPDAQKWRYAQGANVIGCVQGKMNQAGLQVTEQNMPMYLAAARQFAQNAQNAVPSLQGLPINPQSSLVGLGGVAIPQIGLGKNPYSYLAGTSMNSNLGNNPYAYSIGATPGTTSTTQQLASAVGATSFLVPGAASNVFASNPYANQVFSTLPQIPTGY